MKIPQLMTPGPTAISKRVLDASAKPITNPDLDPQFYEYFKEVTNKLRTLYKTTGEVIVMSGEAILGLEAACASFIEPGDRVLCMDNGIFGNGFGDFAKMYGAEVVYFKGDYRNAIDVKALEAFLKEDAHFKLATLVHCETPSGITNPVDHICPLLHQYGILSIVDSVSALGGEPLETDLWHMDVVIGGTQKCLSAAPGLTLMSLSDQAVSQLKTRVTPYPGFYTNLSLYLDWYENKWFPYTQPISAIYQLEAAIDVILEEPLYLEKHAQMAKAIRHAFSSSGFELYPQTGHANTVTAVMVPTDIEFKTLFNTLLNHHNIMIAGSLGELNGKVFRIGHMGEGCQKETLLTCLEAMDTIIQAQIPSVSPILADAFKSYR